MNVDEAMEAAKAYRAAHEKDQEPLFYSEGMAVTLAKEVERLRAELAAAKAASVVPVRVLGIYDSEHPMDCRVVLRCKDDRTKFRVWLRDRMKDNPPPAT